MKDMHDRLFHPLIRTWFEDRFGEPTEPQELGWPHIAAKHHTLIAAPTGSGKTLAAFMVCLDQLLRRSIDGRLEDSIQVVYVSPLKALSNDIHRNLETPLAEIRQLAADNDVGELPIRTFVRTGDTPASERAKMLRRPPHILVTTPESLYILLTSEKSRQILRSVETVIVDEIHALARDKRGSHLSLSLERLAHLCERPPVRIGLSATQRPIDQIAKFLVGSSCEDVEMINPDSSHHAPRDERSSRGAKRLLSEPSNTNGQQTFDFETTGNVEHEKCVVIDAGHVRELDLQLEVPPRELSAVCSHEQWGEVYGRLVELIKLHRSTLIFVNTRRLSERIAHRLREELGEEAVASHHGSLSRKIRHSAEQRLKSGELKAIVATASLEMGIDIGYIDLVCQIGSPRSIATFLQRVGRSGHSLGTIPKGRLFPLTRDELLEGMSLVRAIRHHKLDQIEIPQKPLDILTQQIVAAAACEDWAEDDLAGLCRRAWPFRNLSDDEFESVLKIASDGVAPTTKRGSYLHRDQINRQIRAKKSARLSAITSGGAIPETAEYRVVTEDEKTFVGTLDEDFAIESTAGDIFLLGNTSWRVRYVRNGEVVVQDANGLPPSIPFWFGEGPGRTVELSDELSQLRADISGRTRNDDTPAWLEQECGADAWAAEQAVRYIESQVAAVGQAPTNKEIVFERFFDESGGMQLVIHSPLGARINRAWGLALRKRFCRSFDFELQAAANDNAVLLSIGPQHSFPIPQLFKMISPDNGRYLLEQALLAAPMFQVRWRWNVSRALAVLRFQNGKKVPPYLQRFRSDDILAATFPETVGCLENHHGDVEIPDHPLVNQTMHDCLTEAMDIDRWLELLQDVTDGKVKLVARDTTEPSPFSHEILNANPYAFLDDAPLEERRTRAVTTRRTLSPEDYGELAQLDPAAIDQVRRDAWPLVRNADELHEALMSMIVLDERDAADWHEWFATLVEAGRATKFRIQESVFWTAAERWPIVRAVYDDITCEPAVSLPEHLNQTCERSDGWVKLVEGRIAHIGPTPAKQLAADLSLEQQFVNSSLEALEGRGTVMRGQFTAQEEQWCDRRLLARIHRLTLEGLRRRIQPVSPEDYMRFLVDWHRLARADRWSGPVAVREIIAQLQGFELPAAAWEQNVLAARIAEYDPQWLDQLFLSGEAMWGRLRQPRRDESNGNSSSALTRAIPISLMLRDELPWLLPSDENEEENGKLGIRSNAEVVLDALSQKGALFFQEIKSITDQLPGHIEEALRELAARGFVTSDAFAAVRSIVERRKTDSRRRRSGRTFQELNTPAGRWSRFPGEMKREVYDERLRRWCQQLMTRYGVVFRDVLTRESAAPAWHELVPVLRRMELRGEVRGGRFISGVAGEQFANEGAVEQLRAIREQKVPDDEWFVISAADPLNLVGIVLEGPRVTASHKNSLILRGGHCVAMKQTGQIEFLDEMEVNTKSEMRRALQIGRRNSNATMAPV